MGSEMTQTAGKQSEAGAPALSELREAGRHLLTPDGRMNGRTLVRMRWIGIAGQMITVLVVGFGLGYEMPLGPVLATVGASILVNLVVTFQPAGAPRQARLTDRDAALYLAYDILQLTLLLYLTGGLANPFALLLLAPLTVGASILGPREILPLAGLNIACLTALALWHHPLPWPEGRLALPRLYEFGVWLGLVFSSGLFAAYICRVSEEARRIADALTATQLGLAREQRFSALGALAAAAAHELGTPLGTIAVVAKELSHDFPPDSPYAEDIALLRSQSERCREILARLSRSPKGDGGSPFERLPLSALIESAADPYRSGHRGLVVQRDSLDGTREPVLQRRSEIVHGLGNLLQNALQFANREVTTTATWNQERVTVTINDDGPGFSSHVLARIGEPYISSRSGRYVEGSPDNHMGLGIFIAQTLLERSGASVEFGNNRSGGAQVVVRWPRIRLESEE
jgi:two-component system sensor histidine kinase RegB